MKENQNGVLCDLNNFENDGASLASEITYKDGFWNTPETKCNMLEEGIHDADENEVSDFVAPCTMPSSKTELLKEKNLCTSRNGNENEVGDENEFRDSVAPCTIACSEIQRNTNSYTDKNVKKCELAEVIVRYKENDYHVVKDICIDEGVPFKDKIVIESGNENGLCTILSSDENQNGDIDLLIPNESKSSSEKDYYEDDAHERGNKEEVDMESLLADALKTLLENHLVDDIGNNGGSLAPMQTGEANYRTANKIVDDVSREKSLKSLLESPDSDGNEIQRQSSKILCSEAKCETPAMVSTTEESKNISPDKLSHNSKAESATIAFDFNSSKSAASSRDENHDDVDRQHPIKIDSERRHERGISDISAVGSEIHQGPGESSFSMAGPVSGLITYSGPMTCSGSVSLRSDSSTTSTRSFAFPIIQSEWNSSPIRMAKPDRRHYRKQRGWRHWLLCCRF